MSSRAASARKKQLQPSLALASPANFERFTSRPNHNLPRSQPFPDDDGALEGVRGATMQGLPNFSPGAGIWKRTLPEEYPQPQPPVYPNGDERRAPAIGTNGNANGPSSTSILSPFLERKPNPRPTNAVLTRPPDSTDYNGNGISIQSLASPIQIHSPVRNYSLPYTPSSASSQSTFLDGPGPPSSATSSHAFSSPSPSIRSFNPNPNAQPLRSPPPHPNPYNHTRPFQPEFYPSPHSPPDLHSHPHYFSTADTGLPLHRELHPIPSVSSFNSLPDDPQQQQQHRYHYSARRGSIDSASAASIITSGTGGSGPARYNDIRSHVHYQVPPPHHQQQQQQQQQFRHPQHNANMHPRSSTSSAPSSTFGSGSGPHTRSSVDSGTQTSASFPDSPAATAFVYPGGRSRAHPSGHGAPRFRLRGKKKKDKARAGAGGQMNQGVQAAPRTQQGQGGRARKSVSTSTSAEDADYDRSVPLTLAPSNSTTAQTQTESGLPSPPLSVTSFPHAHPQPRINTSVGVQSSLPPPSGDQQQQQQSPTSPSSSTHSAPAPAQGFIFPSSRSRARPSRLRQPSLPSMNTNSGADRRASGQSWDSDFGAGVGGKSRFMGLAQLKGIALKKKSSELRQQDGGGGGSDPSLNLPMQSALFSRSRQSVSRSVDEHDENERRSLGGAASSLGSIHSASDVGMELNMNIATKVGTYPLDPYDSGLLESDKHTHTLLTLLTPYPSSPSLLSSLSSPSSSTDREKEKPKKILDLGCGSGTWLLDAATKWGAHDAEVEVTGFDMVDITKGLRATARRMGIADRVKFVKGNFIKKPLPFPSNTFDYVRMSCLTFCVPYESWVYVFKEVRRVMRGGGRVEVVDDGVVWPFAARVENENDMNKDITKGGDGGLFDLYEIDEHDHLHPHQLPSSTEDSSSDALGEIEMDDTATVNGVPLTLDPASICISALPHPATRTTSSKPKPRAGASPIAEMSTLLPTPPRSSLCSSSSSGSHVLPNNVGGERDGGAEGWHDQAQQAEELERLFEHMMNYKYGVHLYPGEFVREVMEGVFGEGRVCEGGRWEVRLALPSSGTGGDGDGDVGDEEDVLERCEGVTVTSGEQGKEEMTTFIPLDPTSLEALVSRFPKILLSCKNSLVEYAMEVAEESDEVDEDVMLEAVWEYEGFIKERLNPPKELLGEDASARVHTKEKEKDSERGDVQSTRGSIMTASTLSSDAHSAIKEYQSDIRAHFSNDSRPAPSPARPVSQQSSSGGSGSVKLAYRSSFGSSAGAVPVWRKNEQCKVREFRVWEAVKVDGPS